MTISVDELMADQDFMSPLIRVRNTVTVSSEGVATATPSLLSFLGGVSPKGRRTEYTKDGQRVSGDILIITKTELTVGDNNTLQSDLVMFASKMYTVVNVSDYTTWGAGFYEAIGELIR